MLPVYLSVFSGKVYCKVVQRVGCNVISCQSLLLYIMHYFEVYRYLILLFTADTDVLILHTYVIDKILILTSKQPIKICTGQKLRCSYCT